ncbi:MAG: hypothetical protein M3Y21_07290 [Candidatus Eremiobacteraeota bacterium]|nr:hypothetical protein [Candidatus Eremiobacteraeota bacterium]
MGLEHFTIDVRDSDGRPITGAKVVIFSGYATVPYGHAIVEPGMGRVGPTSRAVDKGNGTYAGQMQLAIAAHWLFAVQVSAGGTQTSVGRGIEVH